MGKATRRGRGHPEAFLVAQFSRQAIRSPRTSFFPLSSYQSACCEVKKNNLFGRPCNTKSLIQHRAIRPPRRRPHTHTHTHSRHELLVPNSGAEDICPSSRPGPCHASSGAEEPLARPIAGSLPRTKTDPPHARPSDYFDSRPGMGASILGRGQGRGGPSRGGFRSGFRAV